MKDSSWLDYMTAFGAIATPIFVVILTALGWSIRAKVERRLGLEDKLRDDRIDAYNQILEPFIIILMTDEAWQSDRKNKGKNKFEFAVNKLLSLEYRKTAFKMSLVGGDDVVKAYNDLMQAFYTRDEGENRDYTEDETIQMMTLLGRFLLEIRRSMGNDATTLNHWDMLEWWMTDARVYRNR